MLSAPGIQVGGVFVLPLCCVMCVSGLEPGQMLSNIFQQVPELSTFANLDLQVGFTRVSGVWLIEKTGNQVLAQR
jgi:hypothetical protein